MQQAHLFSDSLTHAQDNATDDAAPSGKEVAMEQVRELAAKGRLAMVVGDTAYDFTDFANLHPGGTNLKHPKSS